MSEVGKFCATPSWVHVAPELVLRATPLRRPAYHVATLAGSAASEVASPVNAFVHALPVAPPVVVTHTPPGQSPAPERPPESSTATPIVLGAPFFTRTAAMWQLSK